MPVHLRRDEMIAQPESSTRGYDDPHGGLAAGLLAATRSSLLWLALGAVPLIAGLSAMKRVLVAADHLLQRGQGDHWQEMWMPAVLFAFYGALFGALIAWRVSVSAGLSNALICLAAGLVTLLLAVTGGLYALVLFAGAVPLMGWICLAFMTAASLAGAYGLTRWTG